MAIFLPDELLIDILYCLPVKSIGRCFLSHPQFIKLHFNLHARRQQVKLILVSWDWELHTITFNPQNGEIGSISRKLCFPQMSDNWFSVDGSCNGLVLVADRENVQYLINPTTLKCHKIPTFSPQDWFDMYGLGYDVVSDDFKVVALSYNRTNNEGKTVTCVYIYSVRKGLWEKIEDSPYDHSRIDPASGVLVNRALHWLAYRIPRCSSAIAAFDFSVDKFLEVPGPTDLQISVLACNLAAVKGCLCISTSDSPDAITFWIMKDYGVKESWIKHKITESSLDLSLGKVFCVISDTEVLLDVDEEFVVYNMIENRRKDLLIDVDPITYQTRTFIDSLVSPSFGNETEG